MGDRRRRQGAQGEQLAASYLEARGYTLLQRSWRCRYGELDLVMVAGATLVLVEVRTRRGRRAGTVEESLTPRKRRRLALLAELYLQTLARSGQRWDGPWRIDVVAIELGANGEPRRIAHLPAAIER